MTLEADSLAERRRLKRRVRFWRIGAILLAVTAIIFGFATYNRDFVAQLGINPHVARISIEGFIGDDKQQLNLLSSLAENENVTGVIVHINSPGGTTAGAEALYAELRKLDEKKPVVAVFGTAATSAAYLAGVAADHIIARGNTITGSVGVILQWAEVSELLKSWGINMREVRSGDLKAVPSPFTPPDPASQALIQELVRESREWFVGLVAERRNLSPNELVPVRTGKIYSGRQALEAGLIDQIGGEDDALAWLQAERGVAEDIMIIEWKADDSSESSVLMKSVIRFAASAFGIPADRIALLLGDSHSLNQLDGLVSLWHPSRH
ncbi:MAG: signal peptide peptidase SppA [Hyphomicrobiales bacterium]|nr:signal peptide peptidase SppA [Hyphomicrobiales bacterium]